MPIIKASEVKEVPLTQGKVALIDSKDYELVSKYKWSAARCGRRDTDFCAIGHEKVNGKYRTLRMHSLLMRPQEGMVVDHINHNPLDNRRSNLRICTRQQNRFNSLAPLDNTSGYKGVSWHQTGGGRWGYWRVRFTVNGKRVNGGIFKELKEAVLKYNELARVHHGEFGTIHEV